MSDLGELQAQLLHRLTLCRRALDALYEQTGRCARAFPTFDRVLVGEDERTLARHAVNDAMEALAPHVDELRLCIGALSGAGSRISLWRREAAEERVDPALWETAEDVFEVFAASRERLICFFEERVVAFCRALGDSAARRDADPLTAPSIFTDFCTLLERERDALPAPTA